MDALLKLIDHWQRRRILVVGDYMLDHFVYGHAERLSPDAPVPVLLSQDEQAKAGGAANVCLDLQAMHCDVSCFGIVGEDAEAERLIQYLDAAGCDTAGLIMTESRRTTVKRSLIGLAQHRHPQKMFRLDYEDASPINPHLADAIFNAVARQIDQAAVLCLEDYDKGVLTDALCSRLLELAHEHNVPVLVDPALLDDYGKYRRATTITPNRFEAQQASGLPGDNDEALDRLAVHMTESLELDALVLTLDREGMLLNRRGETPTRFPTSARTVYDVTGAGDMVLAGLAAALANGADWPTAVMLANEAAGLEVE